MGLDEFLVKACVNFGEHGPDKGGEKRGRIAHRINANPERRNPLVLAVQWVSIGITPASIDDFADALWHSLRGGIGINSAGNITKDLAGINF